MHVKTRFFRGPPALGNYTLSRNACATFRRKTQNWNPQDNGARGASCPTDRCFLTGLAVIPDTQIPEFTEESEVPTKSGHLPKPVLSCWCVWCGPALSCEMSHGQATQHDVRTHSHRSPGTILTWMSRNSLFKRLRNPIHQTGFSAILPPTPRAGHRSQGRSLHGVRWVVRHPSQALRLVAPSTLQRHVSGCE